MTDTIPRQLIAALTRKAGFYRRYSNDGQTETEALLTAASKALTTALDENEHLRESYGWAVISADTFKDENDRLRGIIANTEKATAELAAFASTTPYGVTQILEHAYGFLRAGISAYALAELLAPEHRTKAVQS